jgi:hypothetical protein
MMMMSWQRDDSWIISQCIESEPLRIIPNISFLIQVRFKFEQKKASQNLRGLIIAALKMDAR